MVRRFTCGASNLQAAKNISIVFAILRIIQLGYAAYALANLKPFEPVGDVDIDPINAAIHDQVKLLLEVNVGLAAAFLFADLGLFMGTIKKFKSLLWFWLVINAISVLCTLIITIMFFSVFTVVYIITAVFSIVITIWAMLVVWGSIQEIQEED